MLGTRQQEIIEALAGGALAYEVLTRRVPVGRKDLLRSLIRLEAAGMVQIARAATRLHAADLVMLARASSRATGEGKKVGEFPRP